MTVIAVSSHDEGNTALLQAGAVTVCRKTELDRIQGVIDRVTARVINTERRPPKDCFGGLSPALWPACPCHSFILSGA